MATSVLVDAGFLVALLNRSDTHHAWSAAIGASHPPPWQTCEAVLSEAFHLVGAAVSLTALLRRGALTSAFRVSDQTDPVLALMERYENVPMSFADACLVRMTEILADPILLTTDADFRIYRRHGRHVVPCALPG
jgi:uncharacterized protein